jgi:hypothetical protein
MTLDFYSKIRLVGLFWFIRLWSGLVFVFRSIPLLAVSLALVALTNAAGDSLAARLSIGGPGTDFYLAVYLGEFSALLVFAAITFGVIQWKVSAHLQTLADQAGYYRSLYVDLAYDLQVSLGETPGVIDLKGIAETLDAIIVTPEFPGHWDRLTKWLQSLGTRPEVHRLRPIMLTGVMALQMPLARATLWRDTTQFTFRCVLLSTYVALWFVLTLAYSQNLICVGVSVLFVGLGVESVGRFLSGQMPKGFA